MGTKQVISFPVVVHEITTLLCLKRFTGKGKNVFKETESHV